MTRRKTDTLERIRIQKPCAADWDSMTGNERVRFCEHCNLTVNDLSRMSRSEALKLVSASGGRLCVRYVRLPDGSVRTADTPPPLLYGIARRASRLAAGAFTAALTLSANVAAQTRAPAGGGASDAAGAVALQGRARLSEADARGAALAGTVIDPAGAVIPGVVITITDSQTVQTRAITSDNEGYYSLRDLRAGSFSLKFESTGFARSEVADVVLQAGEERRVDVTLEVVGTMEMGVVVISEPSEPLVKAAFDNDLKAVEKLLAGGADANVLDRGYDSTALAQAVANGNLEMVKRLLDAGAEIDAENKAGRTALMMIDGDATVDLVRALLDAGAVVKLKDDNGDAALAFAALSCGPEIIRALLDAGAKIDARNDEGRTALMLASEANALEGVRALSAAGADVNLKDDEGETALDLAKEEGHDAVVEFLVAHGAVEGADDDEGAEP